MNNLDQSEPNNCSNNSTNCIEMLELILDGEASHDQKEYFRTHLDDCMPCFRRYHLEMAIRDLLKLKCMNHAPDDLIASIKDKIQNNTVH